ncbi:MAG: hypothetical protein ABSC23_22020 [Bryobacteraceae bacterium]
MPPATAAPVVELATAGMGAEVFDFLYPHNYIHPDLDRDAFAACWKAQFFEAGPACVLVARDGGGRLIAHYGILPMPYAIGGKSARAGFICQLFIDPAWRKTPLFFRLERRLLRDYPEFGFDFLYGLIAIKPALAGHLAMRYTRGPDWSVYAFPVAAGGGIRALWTGMPAAARAAIDAVARPLARAALALRRPAAGRVEVEEVADVGRMDWDLVARAQAGWRVHADRREEAFRRRIAPFGRKRYRVFAAADGKARGYLVLRLTRVKRFAVAAIVDVIVPAGDEQAWNALLAHACHIGLENGSHAVVALARPGSPEARHLRSNLFFRTPSFFTLVYAVPEALRPAGDAAWTGDWGLSWFDHDYI